MGVVENLKDLAELVKKAGQIELYKKISEAEDEVREVAREKRRLEDRVAELERALSFKEETVFRAPFYYLKEGDQTPYCPCCWENQKTPVHVILIFDHPHATRWDCKVCKNTFMIENPGAQHVAQLRPHVPRYTG
jgi:hypothetical protein